MNYFKFPYLYVAIFAVLGLGGCKKMSDDGSSVSTPSSVITNDASPRVVNGIMVFADAKSFDKTLNELYQKIQKSRLLTIKQLVLNHSLIFFMIL